MSRQITLKDSKNIKLLDVAVNGDKHLTSGIHDMLPVNELFGVAIKVTSTKKFPIGMVFLKRKGILLSNSGYQ